MYSGHSGSTLVFLVFVDPSNPIFSPIICILIFFLDAFQADLEITSSHTSLTRQSATCDRTQ
jgi:hypothetical protein